ncbi:MAG: FkbM family methyltransferase [Gemmatimonadetes bacterium]|nr:FkbM family methyltransferase [Gemmatimonadota bacterium]
MSPLRRMGEFVACASALGPDARSRWAILWRQTKNLRARFRLTAYRPDEVFPLDTVYGRLWFRDNFGDITNLPGLLHREVYRPAHPPADGAMLDVGANIGLASAWFAHRYPGRPIHCFEPLSANAAMITRNCPQASINECAVGAEPGTLELEVDADSIMATSIPTRWQTAARRVPVIRLDDYVTANDIRAVSFLKIDTEGMELDVLRGATATLARTDQVALETHAEFRHREVQELLRDAGFRIERASFDGATGMVFGDRPDRLHARASSVPDRAHE